LRQSEHAPQDIVRRDQHAPACLAIADAPADLLDHADAFMAENRARHHARKGSTHHVQIRAADRACGQSNDGILIMLNCRIGYVASEMFPIP
jgi:hypothetical protein